MIRRIFVLLMVVSFVACNNNEPAKKKIENSRLNIMAYYFPREEFHPESLQLDKLTHIIFSFSKVIGGKMQFRREQDGERLEQLVALRQNHPHLKVMVACGGWEADGFSDAALTRESREVFIASAVEMIKKYQLDGLDMDWEYPTSSAAGIKARPEDKENFTALIIGLREALDKLERPQTLTFAAAGWKGYFNYIELPKVIQYVDYINLMTYDQAGGGNKYTAHHTALAWATLKDMEKTPLGIAMTKRNDTIPEAADKWEPQSVERIVDFCLEQGCPANKIVVGAAFYGKGWKGVDPADNGLFQSNKGAARAGNYRKLLDEYIDKNGYIRHWDPVARAPFLFNPTDSVFITYDDPESVALKTRFATDKQLGGIMFWELGGDTDQPGGLLDAIFEAAVQ